MRDKRFVAAHRGGPLDKERHRLLMAWAIECARRALRLMSGKPDERLMLALQVAGDWNRGATSVGEARSAALGAIAAANESTDPIAIAAARAVGHAVATAHMADHSLGAADYALKAARAAGKSVGAERKWQEGRLRSQIRELVLSARKKRPQVK